MPVLSLLPTPRLLLPKFISPRRPEAHISENVDGPIFLAAILAAVMVVAHANRHLTKVSPGAWLQSTQRSAHLCSTGSSHAPQYLPQHRRAAGPSPRSAHPPSRLSSRGFRSDGRALPWLPRAPRRSCWQRQLHNTKRRATVYLDAARRSWPPIVSQHIDATGPHTVDVSSRGRPETCQVPLSARLNRTFLPFATDLCLRPAGHQFRLVLFLSRRRAAIAGLTGDESGPDRVAHLTPAFHRALQRCTHPSRSP